MMIKVTVMAWVYGADKFLEDLRYMLGFYPYPYYFWYWAWKIVSPAIVLVSSSTPSRVHFTHCGAPLWNIFMSSSEHPPVHCS